MQMWDEQYKEIEKGIHYKIFHPSVLQSPPVPSGRQRSTIIFRLRSGHCRLNAHLHKIKIIESPNCPHCARPETVEHFLLACPKYDPERTPLLEHAQRLGIPLTLRYLLTDSRIIAKVVEYVRSCRRQI